MASAEEHRGIAAAVAAGAVTASAVLAACAAVRAKGADEPEVTASEDLMREHGILRRILLVYEEGLARLDRMMPPPLDEIGKAAEIVRRFVEEYHEETEERYVFPLFEKAGTLVDLVRVLRAQHDAGRRLTDAILKRTATGEPDAALAGAITAFTRMYRPHAAFEDTVLFPRMRELLGARAYAELGETFEQEERLRFGRHGFERIEAEVSRLEERLGIHDIARFTPR